MILDEDDYLAHYGVLRKSGRYPWGSGNTEYSRSVSFLDNIAQLREKGMSDVDIAKGFGMTIKELRETNTIAINAKRAEADALFHRVGITFAVYGDEGGAERLIPFDIIPRIIPAAEWRFLSDGLRQRVRPARQPRKLAG